MARVKNNALLAGVSGRIGDSIVIKQYSYGTVISAMPDMSRVKKSKLQKVKQTDFAKAVAYAQSIIRDKKKKEKYAKNIEKGKTVYHAAIKEYLDKVKKG
jgi:hemerythrin superfamily protein